MSSKAFAPIMFIMLAVFALDAQGLKDRTDSLSYSIGVVVAQNIKDEGLEQVDAQIMAKAIKDVLYNLELEIDEQSSDSLFRAILLEIRTIEKEMNKAVGESFLEENAGKPNVVVLPSGLQYEILEEGEGPHPGINSTVKTHYHGTLIDGTVFDSSVRRNEPISFPLRNVIQAWQEALPLMKVGSKWKIFSPYELAYGDRQAGPLIKPYSALIFEIELLEIQ